MIKGKESDYRVSHCTIPLQSDYCCMPLKVVGSILDGTMIHDHMSVVFAVNVKICMHVPAGVDEPHGADTRQRQRAR